MPRGCVGRRGGAAGLRRSDAVDCQQADFDCGVSYTLKNRSVDDMDAGVGVVSGIQRAGGCARGCAALLGCVEKTEKNA